MSFGHSEVMHQSLSINTRVSALIGDKVLGFVKDYDVSAKDPEPMRRSIVSAGDCRVWHSSDTHDHTDVFVLLVCWMFRHDIQAGRVAEGTIWNINSTCAEFGPKCLHILGMDCLTVSDTTSYPYTKDNASVLKTLRAVDFPGLSVAYG